MQQMGSWQQCPTAASRHWCGAVQVNEGAWRASGPTPDLYNLLCPIMGPKPQNPDPRDIPVSSETVATHPYLYTDEDQLDLVEAFRNVSAPEQVKREVNFVSNSCCLVRFFNTVKALLSWAQMHAEDLQSLTVHSHARRPPSPEVRQTCKNLVGLLNTPGIGTGLPGAPQQISS